MTRLSHIPARLFLGAAFTVAFAATGLAQDRPRNPRDYAPPPPVNVDAVCKDGVHARKDLVIYDPLLPATLDDENHRDLEQAICHARPSKPASGSKPAVKGATIMIYRDPAKPVLPPILINKPGLTLVAADAKDGGTVIVKQAPPPENKPSSKTANGSCVLINPEEGGRYDKDVTTTLEGFTFLATPGKKACIHVERGTLILKNSRIIMSGAGTAIYVSPTASLVFEGNNYLEHGVFHDTPGNAPKTGIGVFAENSLSVTLKHVRLEGLNTAFDSRARSNKITALKFVSNNEAVKIKDAAVISAYSPNLDINGVEFSKNGTALTLAAASFNDPAQADNATAAATDAKKASSEKTTSPTRPFRGKATINKTTFAENTRGVLFDGAFPQQLLEISGAEFDQNSEYALKLPLPESAGGAKISDTKFTSNAKAIVLDGSLDSSLTIDTGSKITGAISDEGVILGDGAIGGVFDATLTTTGDLLPAVKVLPGWKGKLSLSVAEQKTISQVLTYDGEASMCTYNFKDSDDVRKFRKRLQGMKLHIGGVHIAAMFGKPNANELSRRKLQYAKNVLCGAIPIPPPPTEAE